MIHFKQIRIIYFGIFFSVNSLFSQEYITHSIWNELTSRYVSPSGKVDYPGIKKEEKKLNLYLSSLSDHHPNRSWKKNDQLAFWINAYNAFTVKLILLHYPIKSIKDIAGGIYKVNTPWDIKFIHIGKKTYDLNNIEHGILRKSFHEPRIHFALNCASVSCPPLRNEAYVGDKINAQLDDQASRFINDKTKNNITTEKAELSKIFQWYGHDFKSKYGSYTAFINQYAEEKIGRNAKIIYLSYDWKLND